MNQRGFTLVETLAALAITGALLAVLSGVLFQAALGAERQDALATRNEAASAARLLIQARLDAIALVADRAGAREPRFEIGAQRLVFVSRFAPPAPLRGLWEVTFTANADTLDIVLEDWPDARQRETLTLDVPGIQFTAAGMDSIVKGLPRAVILSLPSGPVWLELGAHLPLDCVLTLPPAAHEEGGLLCPGQVP